MANKVCALFGRALPRDFLDVDATLMSGRYTREQLLELAAAADHGFDPLIFAEALGRGQAAPAGLARGPGAASSTRWRCSAPGG